MKKFVAIALGTFFAFAVCEAVLRVYPMFIPVRLIGFYSLQEQPHLRKLHQRAQPRGYRLTEADKDLRYEHELGYQYRPNLDVTLKTPEWTYQLKTDTHGFSNTDEALYQKADLVVLGDSFAQGTGVAGDENWVQRLRSEKGLRVLNLGHGSYDAYHYPIVYRRFASRTKAPITLLCFFGLNDMRPDFYQYAQWAKQNPSATFLDYQKELIRRKPDELIDPPYRLLHQKVDFLLRKSYALTWVFAQLRMWRERLRHSENRPVSPDAILVLGGKELSLPFFSSERMPYRDWMERHHEEVEYSLQAVRQVDQQAKNTGSRLVLLYFPSLQEVYWPLASEDMWKRWESFFAIDSRIVIDSLSDPSKRLRQFCEKQDIVFLDLTPVLKEKALQGEPLYFPHDGHWTPKGHEVVAQAIGLFLKEASLGR